jgi:hypothetical protein
MPTPYIVRRGDYLSKIARKHGFRSWREIYYHPANAAFRTLRPNPNLIYPGDVVQIPEAAAPGTTPVAPTPLTTITDEKCCHLARKDKECQYNGAKSNWICPEGYVKQHWDCMEGTRRIGCGECVKSPAHSCYYSDSTDTSGDTFACSIWWWY